WRGRQQQQNNHAEANLTQNQIRYGLLELLCDIEARTAEISSRLDAPMLRAEMEQAISIVNSKNAVSGSTLSAGGNLHIGDIIQYGEQKIPRALTKSPFLSEVFLGREDDIKAIRQKLFSGDNLLLLVNGQGGVGKTSIAAHYYARFQAEYAHTAWVLSERSIANALLINLATPLGLSFAADAPEAERLDDLLRVMANLDKPCLLVIDNVNEVDDLQQNYQHLRRCLHFHLLLTSRIREFRQAAFYPINGLPEPQALELFERYYKPLQAGESAIFSGIYKAVEGNTLVVEVLAKNLFLFNRLKRHYAVADLLADLQTRGLLALSKSQAVEVDYHTYQNATPEAIIAAMYDLGELERAETALLSVFAVLPAESIGFETLESLLPGLADLEKNALSLAQRGW
ncbi:MAG: NB-ARC domain-containing protein, partial [Saprospiraceae bacterium]|nr:NB-ARC domain-containing protein [Saprospiraceae bacterium]